MKKALVSGALGLSLLGAAVIPAQSAFGNASQRWEARCEHLVDMIQLLRAQYDAASGDPYVQAAIARGGQKVVNKATRLGCTVPPHAPTP